MEQLDLAVAILGALVLALSLATGLLRERAYLPSEPMVAVAVGIAVGPVGLDVLELAPLGDPQVVLEEVARLTVALAVTSIALRLPPSYYREHARALLVVLGPGMALMWLASALLGSIVLGLSIPVALLLGAVVTPTDPVLANSIVVGRSAREHIPERVRYLLSGEAGINDGAAAPFVFLPLLVLQYPVDAAMSRWLVEVVLWQVGGGVAAGLALGAGIGRVEALVSGREPIEETSVFTVAVATTFAVLGVAALLGVNEVLAVFVAGAAYNRTADPRDEADQQRIEEVFNRLFTLPVFVFLGMALPVAAWLELGWRGPAFVAGVLLLRRLPAFGALARFVPPLRGRADAVFVGWFGPIGVAAILYATHAVRLVGTDVVWTAASLVVVGSVVAHGATATPLSRWLGGAEAAD